MAVMANVSLRKSIKRALLIIVKAVNNREQERTSREKRKSYGAKEAVQCVIEKAFENFFVFLSLPS